MYKFQGEKYNPNKLNTYKYNNNYYSLRKESSFSNARYEPYKVNNSYSQQQLKLPYLTKNKLENSNPNYIKVIENDSGDRENDENSEYYPPNKVVCGLPLIIHKAKTKKLYENTSSPNLVISNEIQENIKNFPSKIYSPTPLYESQKVYSKKKKKDRNASFKKIMKKSRTEERINKNKKVKYFLNTEMKRNYYIKWWKLIKYFMEIYSFFSILKKYTKKIKKIRKKKITLIERYIVDDVNTIRNWMIDIQGNYWNDLYNFKDIKIEFTENDSNDKIFRSSKILVQLIYNYFHNLTAKTIYDLKQIPEVIQQIIYSYIKQNTYFPKNYLDLFQIERLKFNFYGSCENSSLEESAMILSYLLISSISVQQIFLNIKMFTKLRDYENVSIICKYLASIICYMHIYTFFDKTKRSIDYIDLYNYFRCYKIKNDLIEKENNFEVLLGMNNNMIGFERKVYINNNKYYKFLIDDKIINKFWEINSNIMKNFSNSLFIWAMNLSKLILYKYNK
jgi:hypothetical protein